MKEEIKNLKALSSLSKILVFFYKTILLYCLNCKKIQKVKIKVASTKNGRIMLYQIVQCVKLKNQKLLNRKKQVHY